MHVDLPSLEGKVLPCVPCRNDKRPTTPHGFRDATNSASLLGVVLAVPRATDRGGHGQYFQP